MSFSALFLVLVVHVHDLLDLITRAEEDTAAVVDVLGDDGEETVHLRVDGATAGILEDHSHGSALVQNAQFALGALGVGWVGEDAAVEQGAVGVGDHAADVAGGVGLLALAGELEGVEVSVGPLLPVHAVTLVDGVDGAGGGQLHVGVGEDELAQRVLEGEAVDGAVAHGDDELGGCAVHGETRGDHLGAGAEHVLGGDLVAEDLVGQLEDAEDGANRNARVQVGRSVDGVADDGVARLRVLVEQDRLVLLLGDENAAFAGAAHRRHEDIVSDHVQLLLVVAGRVGGAGQTGQVDQGGPTDVVGDGFEGELEGVAEEAR